MFYHITYLFEDSELGGERPSTKSTFIILPADQTWLARALHLIIVAAAAAKSTCKEINHTKHLASQLIDIT